MSLDGIVVHSIVKELEDKLVGGRVDKIYQNNDDLSINIYNKGENHQLFLSANSNMPRLCITDRGRENLPNPPMFCMLLRKHLTGGRILNISQFLMDRIVFIDISSLDELGEMSEKRLVIEIMGRHSNIILIDKDSFKIIDSIKRISQNISRVRQVLPGLDYLYPSADKLNPLELNEEGFYPLLEKAKQNTQLFRFFYMNYMGIGPLIGRELCHRAKLEATRPIASLEPEEKQALYRAFEGLVEKIKDGIFKPVLIKDGYENNFIAFHALDIKQFGEKNKFHTQTVSQAISRYYYKNSQQNKLNQRSQSIVRTIETHLERSQKKLAKQKQELLEAQDRDKYKIYGDLISANIYHIEAGSQEVEVDNFYSENMDKIKIPLDERYSAVENAQRYYKKYSKLKNANLLLGRQIRASQNEIDYLEQVLISIDNCDGLTELEEIREELIKEKYLREGRRKTKRSKAQTKPHHYISSDGLSIYVGKNNRQNDYLSLRFAHREDLWLHAQKIPGSHVIIKNEGRDVPPSTLEEAATLAAYFSKAKFSANVPIDYTERKNVRKARGAKTGMVIYDNFSTIFVDPDANKIQGLKKVE